MDPITLMAIMSAAGLLKSSTIDAAKEGRDRKLASETQRLSPWTGLRAEKIQEADPFGSALQFGATGAQLGQGMQNSAAQGKLLDAQAQWLNSGGSPQQTSQMGSTWGAYGPKNVSGLNYSKAPNDFWGVGSF